MIVFETPPVSTECCYCIGSNGSDVQELEPCLYWQHQPGTVPLLAWLLRYLNWRLDNPWTPGTTGADAILNECRQHRSYSEWLPDRYGMFLGTTTVMEIFDPWEMRLLSWINNLQTHIKDKYLQHFLENCPHVNTKSVHWWLVNIGSGNDLVPSGTKPLPELIVIQFFVAMWRH